MSTIVNMKERQVRVSAGARARASESSGLARIVALFAADLGSLLDFDSLEYRNSHRDVAVALGGAGQHQCSYSLRHEDLFLGELLLTRGKPFRESELQQLERCLGALVPLLIGELKPD